MAGESILPECLKRRTQIYISEKNSHIPERERESILARMSQKAYTRVYAIQNNTDTQYIYIYTHVIHTHTRTHAHTHTHTRTHARTHTHTHSKLSMRSFCFKPVRAGPSPRTTAMLGTELGTSRQHCLIKKIKKKGASTHKR